MEVRKVGMRVWFDATRPFAFPASVLGVLVGTAAAARISQWRWGVLAAELAAVMLMHAIGNLLNDYYDYRSGVDARTEDDEGRPGRFLVKGILLPKDVLRLVLILCHPARAAGRPSDLARRLACGRDCGGGTVRRLRLYRSALRPQVPAARRTVHLHRVRSRPSSSARGTCRC